jgi:uncharacterized membrane protein YfcA
MPDLVFLCAVLLVAALVQGFLGFGFGIIAMSALTLSSDLVHASGIVNLTGILLAVAMLWREGRQVLWPLVLRIALPMMLGLFVGLFALQELDRATLVRLLGVTTVGIAIWNLASPTLRRRESLPLDIGVGMAAGLLSGAFNTGGPPLVLHLYRRPEAPIRLVVTLQAIFLTSGLMRGAMASAQGLIDSAIGFESLVAAPFVAAGALLGARAARRTDPLRFRRAAWLVLGALGTVLLVTA